MTLMRNDKVILVKPYNKLKNVGETYEVANILENGQLVLRTMKTKVAIATIDVNEFKEYFTTKLVGWTSWNEILSQNGALMGWYRSNGKKVQVKTNNGERAESSCYKTDEFDLYTGVNIALGRCHIKFLNNMKKDYSDSIKQADSDLIRMEDTIRELIRNVKPITTKE